MLEGAIPIVRPKVMRQAVLIHLRQECRRIDEPGFQKSYRQQNFASARRARKSTIKRLL
jgi:hypothetical protein